MTNIIDDSSFSEREILLFEEQENFFYDFLVKNVTPYFPSDPELNTQLHLIAHTFTHMYMCDTLLASINDPENTPAFYLPGLLALIGYDYDDSIDPDIHRIAYKYLFDWQRNRGSEISILKAASYAGASGWVCGEYFLPGYKNPGITASIAYPSKNIFHWNISSWSGAHKYYDGAYYTKGVIDLYVDSLTDKVIQAVKSVLPAGIKVYFRLNRQLTGSADGVVLANYFKSNIDLFLMTWLSYTEGDQISDRFIWNVYGRMIWGGSHRSLVGDLLIIFNMSELKYNFSVLDDSVQVTRFYGTRIWSSRRSSWSSRNTWSGNKYGDSGQITD